MMKIFGLLYLPCLAVWSIGTMSALGQDGQAPQKKTPSKSEKPNIIFILADDMGWAQPGFNGGNVELTPHMDGLAKQGMSLTHYYTHSVCAPTRAAFLTGKYAFRTWSDWRSEDFGKPSYLKALGLTLAHNAQGEPTRRIHGLATEERTIAEALRDEGYFTSIIGKWHCGEWLPEHLPMAQGFMHQYGHYAWGIDYYTKTIVHNAPARFAVYDWHRNQQPIQEEGYATDLIGDEAAAVIGRQKKGKPFFMYVAFNAVHGPLNKTPRYASQYKVRDAMLKCLDDNVGKIVKAVDGSGLAGNTIIIFTNDNGPVLKSMSKPYRGTKNTTFEGGVRVPCIIRWPSKLKAQSKNDEMMFVTDWYKTFLHLAGSKAEQKSSVDSLDMSQALLTGKAGPRKEIIYEVSGSVRVPTIRSGDFKLMGKMLFNIKEDPAEQHDIAAKHPKLVAELTKRLKVVSKQRPPLGEMPLLMNPPLPYVYGQPENKKVPDWLKVHVDKVRAKQPKTWAKGETPWPKAPVGVNASQKQDE